MLLGLGPFTLEYAYGPPLAVPNEKPLSGRSVSLRGTAECLAPSRYAGRLVECRIIEARFYNEMGPPAREDGSFIDVGYLVLRGKVSEFTGAVPPPDVWKLGAAIASRQVRFLLLSGPAFVQGRMDVTDMQFSSGLDLDDSEELAGAARSWLDAQSRREAQR